MRLALILLATGLAQPAALAAEGAQLSLACELHRSCNEAGACDAFGGTQQFTLAPVSTDTNGTGDWTVAQDGGEALPARGLAHTGPWVWQPGDGHLHTLSLTGEASALRIRQWLPTERYPVTYAEIDIMTCEVTG
ncbi:MAG: hypothetical protein JXQ91_03250 [Vannielia sp.]|uniref:hypothetical protein n=1 Tax=Vannielia sp. TaxID=2813045 RepID=UPI003B8AB379